VVARAELDAAVVGAGVKTPAGSTPDQLWANALAARSGIAAYQDPRLPASVAVVAGQVTGFDPLDYAGPADATRLDRLHLLAIGAADDALAGIDRPPPDRCAVVCGVGYGAAASLEELHRTVVEHGIRGLTPFSVPLNMANSAAAHLAMRYGFQGACLTISTACAAGADAIGQGLELLRRGEADLVLAGGVDAPLTLTPVLSFYRMGALTASLDPALASRPFDRDRDGFVLGEGAGFVVLRRAGDADRDRAAVLGRVTGYRATCDAFHIVAPRSDGVSARRCAELALVDAGIDTGQVGHVNAHGTSTPRNDVAEARAMTELFDGRPPPVTAVKSVTGHMIGGSGAVEAIVTLLSLRDGLVPPVAGYRTPDPDIGLDVVAGQPRKVSAQYAISNSFAFGGHNAVLVLAAAEETG